MKTFRSRVAASLAVLSVATMTATPVMARGHYDWGGPRHHRGGGISGGDVLAGLLVIGGVAAIASAASKKSSTQDQNAPETYRYPGGPAQDEGGYVDAPVGDSGSAPRPYPYEGAVGVDGQKGNFGAAVDTCADEIERENVSIESVDSVRRMGVRYAVQGRLQDGRGYVCSIDEGGQIRSATIDGQAAY